MVAKGERMGSENRHHQSTEQHLKPTRARFARDHLDQPDSLIRSKARVSDHGEVFTPSWLVDEMLTLVEGETDRVDSRFLESACGSGNFLVEVLIRKLASVERRYGRSNFDKRNYALLALMSTYGIELLQDNVAECREKMIVPLVDYLKLDTSDALYRAATRVLEINIVQADALSMTTAAGGPLIFAEWSYLNRGRFQRRDFQFSSMTQRSSFSRVQQSGANRAKHEIFTPLRVYAPASILELGS